MDDFKGTPGPWEVKSNGREVSSTNLVIADVWYMGGEFPSQKQGKYNAKLIASAPDMINSLIEIKTIIESSGSPHAKLKLINQELSVINKALGK